MSYPPFMSPRVLRVLLVDDQAEYRRGLAATLSVVHDLRIVGEARDGIEALEKVDALRPDAILMDLRMPRMDGVLATRRILERHPTCRIVALTTFADDELVLEALRAGASGYVLKGTAVELLLTAIRGTRGETILSPSAAATVVRELQRAAGAAPLTPSGLSPRQVEVARLVARGACNKEIAVALGVAEGTVKNHVTHVLEKLGVENRTQAALRARDLGLL